MKRLDSRGAGAAVRTRCLLPTPLRLVAVGAAMLGLSLLACAVPPATAGPTYAEAVRFLEQATFGPTPQDIAHLQEIGVAAWLDEQLSQPLPSYPDLGMWPQPPPDTCTGTCLRDNYSMYPLQVRSFQNALTAPDQLRQRVAFALNQVFVISALDGALTQPSRMLPYLQVLDRNAFGSFRQLLTDITLNPGMGAYLDMVNNNQSAPNENYARELLQLFTVGVNELNKSGVPVVDETGQPVPVYDQSIVTSFARVFTGWVFAPPPASGIVNYFDPMVPGSASNHDTGAKVLLDGVTLPAGQTAEADLVGALDNVFAHPNVAPFVSQRLIRHLVTSNPSPSYVRRVARVFQASQGDMKTVIRAVLLDPEARADPASQPTFGHLREPVLWLAGVLRAFNTTAATTDFVLADSFLPTDVVMSQDLFRSPSVFNFYPQSYVVGDGTVLGPEFAIYSTATALARTNLGYEIVYKKMPTSGNRPTGTWLDLTAWQPLAADVPSLVESLNQLLLHGTMTADMRTVVTDSVSAISSTDSLSRVRAAVYLIVTSPPYLVER